MDRRCCPLRPAASPPINCAIPMVIRLNSLLTRATPFPHDGKIFGRAGLGIDHSAISITDTKRSVMFYEQLGLTCIGSSLNRGPEQDELDGIAEAFVEVTALALPISSTPHIELLCYRDTGAREWALPNTNDMAATRLVLAVDNNEILQALCAQCSNALLSGPVRFESGAFRAMLRDPDGHSLCLEAPP